MIRMNEQEAYERLADFIQDYIYDNGWEHLSSMQIRAVGAVLEKKHNLLFTAGTAMGKTEAALMPALTDIYEHPADSVGILYISPLKALINDQFCRMEEMLAGTGLFITKWHGDAAVSRKEKLLCVPGGILQTTPESLEAMLCRHPENVRILFSDLQYIVIDEIHYFMGNQRGLQLLALLERMQRIIGREPVRLGLSATIGDSRQALAYLNAGSTRKAKVIDYKEERRQYLISVTSTRIGGTDYPVAYGKKILKQSMGKRTLLFTNSRRECEILVAQVRRLALRAGLPDCYYIHHGSISRELREEAELQMKQREGPVLTGTTLTLELGIDIGDLDEVIQASQPLRISSMVQRVGRSGRKTMQSRIAFHLRYFEAEGGVLENLDLSLVRTIAMIELYFREKYLESVRLPRFPMNLLVHETLSILSQKGCLYPHRLAEELLELAIFRHISQDELKQVLRAMMEKDYIRMMNEHVESYADISCTVADGVKEGSYVVAAVYQMKFTGADETLPGMNVFYVQTDKDGKLYINNLYSSFNRELKEQKTKKKVIKLIEEFEKSADVQRLQNEVQTEYDNKVAENEDLQKKLNEMVDAIANWKETYTPPEDNGEEDTEQKPEESEEPAATDDGNADDGNADEGNADDGNADDSSDDGSTEDGNADNSSDDGNADDGGNSSGLNYVPDGTVLTANDGYNVRKSMDETSELVGTTAVGDSIKVILSYAEGWTKVEWNGTTGYIRTDLLLNN
mgnify:CR=1 FL=1